MRITVSTAMTQILPSPILPVRAARDASVIGPPRCRPTISILTLGTKSIVYSVPRYTSVCPLAAEALYLADGHALDPASFNASFTSSILNGLTMAVINFMTCSSPQLA